MGKKSDLSPECQKFVKKLFAFFSKDKATKKPIVSFDRVYQRTSKALGVSYTSVHRIMNGKSTPIIDNRHLIVQNSSIITYFFISISKINESQSKFRL
jgi:hypothetical protein